ncbi:HEPN domain-containing protein [Actinoplanes sp. L3-i22]|uniref:HEPN domain-containing protein n=1 Tax=Actinoplanes sp. L3-i22 TaxID=2836373 RepID=UPI001C744EFC|nr:HEPN domain-containing protein [Actinoplanes sp. L3-i22]BCY05402.1 hypothetical protein L3i22_004900 [Actinoplanes sp. L3-i22]
MGAHDFLVSSILGEADRLLKRTDSLKTYLLAALSLSRQDPRRWNFATLEARASAVIYTVAELESLTKYLIRETHKELNGNHQIKDLIPCLRQLAAHEAFESLRDLSDATKVWPRRAEATTLDLSGLSLKLPIITKSAQPPMDGKTPNPQLYARIWDVYGLPGTAFPYARWDASMRKLGGVRNDLAHGNIPFHQVFQSAGMNSADVERYVDDVTEFALHLVDCWTSYLDQQMYLVSSGP